TFYKDGTVTRSGDGVIDANEMRAILADPDKKARFLEAISQTITRYEKEGHKDPERLDIAERLKVIYYDISSGKTAQQLQEDLDRETNSYIKKNISEFIKKAEKEASSPEAE
ncbi:MAG: hypothetical protein LBD62_04590, partial [Candidatus Margulisbacteria bacterium]|nr:hypothetical protein [Candidatus Margulisiibacteriota bacterium]